jgi:molecular chaperone HscA
MALLQISEPGEATAPHEHRLAAGIDLGTTNSLVASVRSGVPDTLPDREGRHLLPSVVHYLATGEHQVGTTALKQAADDPLNHRGCQKSGFGTALRICGRRVGYAVDSYSSG